jgi:hypothetical protein
MGQRKVAPLPEKYQSLIRNRLPQKRWHVSQVFERARASIIAGFPFNHPTAQPERAQVASATH